MNKILGITASASSVRSSPTYIPELAIDEDMNTGWSSANKTAPQYIQFELPGYYTTNEIMVACNSTVQPLVFDLFIAEDDDFDFQLVRRFTINTSNTLQSFTYASRKTKHIKLLFVSGKSSYYEIREFEVYGELFTIPPLTPESKKSKGSEVSIQFTQEIIGMRETEITNRKIQTLKGGYLTARGTYSSYDVVNVFDENPNTFWQTSSASNYIQYRRKNMKLVGVSLTGGSSYSPLSYTLQISRDGAIFETIKTGSIDIKNKEELIMLDAPVITNYLRIIFGRNGSYARLYFLGIFIRDFAHQQSIGDYTLTGTKFKYVCGPDHNGELVPTNHPIKKVQFHPTNENTILLEIEEGEYFNNNLGNMTLSYNQALGLTEGVGGGVESFTEEFTPTGLTEDYSERGIVEKISSTLKLEVEFLTVEKLTCEMDEHLSSELGVTVYYWSILDAPV